MDKEKDTMKDFEWVDKEWTKSDLVMLKNVIRASPFGDKSSFGKIPGFRSTAWLKYNNYFCHCFCRQYSRPYRRDKTIVSAQVLQWNQYKRLYTKIIIWKYCTPCIIFPLKCKIFHKDTLIYYIRGQND